MSYLDDPGEMTAEKQMVEVAAILALGYLRLGRSPAEPACTPTEPAFTENPLDSLATPMPLWDEGLTDRDPTPMEAGG